MLKIYKDERGFSIVQVMVAIGLSAVLSLAVMKISSNMNTVQSEAEGSFEESELKLQLRMILDKPSHCTVSLAGLDPINSPVTFKKTQIDEPDNGEGLDVELFHEIVGGRVKRFTGNPNDTTPTLVKLRKIEIESIKLAMPSLPQNTNYPLATMHTDIGQLIVNIKKNKREKNTHYQSWLP